MSDREEPLDLLKPQDVEWLVRWTTQETSGEPASPLQAAANAWRESFGRRQATDGDACVFEVEHPGTGQSATVDLSDYDLEALRPWGEQDDEHSEEEPPTDPLGAVCPSCSARPGEACDSWPVPDEDGVCRRMETAMCR